MSYAFGAHYPTIWFGFVSVWNKLLINRYHRGSIAILNAFAFHCQMLDFITIETCAHLVSILFLFLFETISCQFTRFPAIETLLSDTL